MFFAKSPGSLIKAIVSGAGESSVQCRTPVTASSCLVPLQFPDVLYNQQDTTPSPFPVAGARSPVIHNPSGLICPDPTCGIRAIDPEAERPRAYKAEAAIEQELPWSVNFSASYIFTRGVKLPSNKDANVLPATVMKTYDVVNSATPGVTELTSTVPLFTNRVDPRTGSVLVQRSEVNSTYHGMLLAIRKPMTHGIELLANYTLGRAVDNGQQGFNISSTTALNTPGVLNPFDMRAEQGPSSTDARNRFTSSVIWMPPFGRNAASPFVRKLVEGWSFSTSITATNGTHYSGRVQSSASPCSVAITPGFTNCTNAGGVSGLQGGMTGVLMQTTGNAFGGRIAWLPRASFTLPNIYNVDFRMAKQIAITERLDLELRGEAFNLFNTTLVLNVNQNAYNYAEPNTAACAGHTNTCMVPVSSFQNPSVTSSTLLGARQIQFGARLSF
jgi:hypothetical protein